MEQKARNSPREPRVRDEPSIRLSPLSRGNVVEDLEKRVGYYERLARDANERLRDIPLVEAKIVELCGKYERKFHLKRTVTQVATVVKSIVGVAKGPKTSRMLKLIS